jgi:hypothetical protein
MTNVKNVTILVSGFIAIIIGAALIVSVASEEQALTTLTQVTNEQIDVTSLYVNSSDVNASLTVAIGNPPTTDSWKYEDSDCLITNFVLSNTTDDFTVTTDYAIDTQNGTFNLEQTTAALTPATGIGDNITLADYQYCGDDYIREAWQRNVSDLVPGFFGIAILGIGVGLIFAVLRNEGLLKI